MSFWKTAENIREIIEEIYPELLNDSNIQKILEQNPNVIIENV